MQKKAKRKNGSEYPLTCGICKKHVKEVYVAIIEGRGVNICEQCSGKRIGGNYAQKHRR
jgi:hypothetical protein